MLQPKKLVCIFAHPDDESFACGGTIAKFANDGVEIHEICVTSGDFPHDAIKGKRREKELLRSAGILGVKSVSFLRFHDGELCNSNYHKIAVKITKILDKLKPDTILTFNQNGVSGHIDHVAVSMICSYLFEQINYIKRILYLCASEELKDRIGKKYFIYLPDGYKEDQVDWSHDVSRYFDTKIKSMKAHKSQLKDYLMLRTLLEPSLKKELFNIKTKK